MTCRETVAVLPTTGFEAPVRRVRPINSLQLTPRVSSRSELDSAPRSVTDQLDGRSL